MSVGSWHNVGLKASFVAGPKHRGGFESSAWCLHLCITTVPHPAIKLPTCVDKIREKSQLDDTEPLQTIAKTLDRIIMWRVWRSSETVSRARFITRTMLNLFQRWRTCGLLKCRNLRPRAYKCFAGGRWLIPLRRQANRGGADQIKLKVKTWVTWCSRSCWGDFLPG